MRSGRPPTWNIAAGFDEGAWTGIAEVTSKDRLLLPSSVRQRVNWLEAGGDQHVLAEIHGDAVQLRQWLGAGDELVGELQRAAASLLGDARHDLIIAAMDRYSRLSVGADGRVVLPTHLAHHLGADSTNAVRIVVRAGSVWLWSETSWKKERVNRHLRLDMVLNGPAARPATT